MGVPGTLCQKKANNGSGQTAKNMTDVRVPCGGIAREDRPSQMIDCHGENGDEFQLVAAQSLFLRCNFHG
jgi:hypothetical protein